ncbi:MAG: hypothetical protein M0D53_14190 [Flavobacterium sp. JAD_PAG50586_2]|nr:MAG: hypothetical protein M0D53_14190 [Flavobacterium sp. JAD_PAG50586_2]
MEAIRNWQKVNEKKYIFSIGEKKVGELDFSFKRLNAVALLDINGELFTIERRGFWKNKLYILDAKQNSILTATPENWFSSNTEVSYKGIEFQLKVRNNPLAEIVLLQKGKEILSYGLKSNDGKITVGIQSSQEIDDYLFDFLLWFLFMPVAHEQTGDDFTFQLLQTS